MSGSVRPACSLTLSTLHGDDLADRQSQQQGKNGCRLLAGLREKMMSS